MIQRTDDHDVATKEQALAASARSVGVLEEAAITASPARQGIINTVPQERIVQHRGDSAAVVSTSSKRIGRYEWGNRENALGWYQGDGVFYPYHRNDSGQFSDDFWPTVYPYALPGITVNGEVRESGKAAGTGIPRAKTRTRMASSLVESWAPLPWISRTLRAPSRRTSRGSTARMP